MPWHKVFSTRTCAKLLSCPDNPVPASCLRGLPSSCFVLAVRPPPAAEEVGGFYAAIVVPGSTREPWRSGVLAGPLGDSTDEASRLQPVTDFDGANAFQRPVTKQKENPSILTIFN